MDEQTGMVPLPQVGTVFLTRLFHVMYEKSKAIPVTGREGL
jgi:hypothetical protein